MRKLIGIMDDPNASADDVKEILSSDQALASKVLKLANSSFYGLSGEVSTISRAVVIMGFAAVRNLATGLGLVKLLGKTSTEDIQRDFWNHAITAAAAAFVASQDNKDLVPEEAFIAGLLHDLGQLLLVLAVPEEYKEVVALGPDDMIANEERIIGLNHNRAGQKLLHHWKLPKALCDAARFHHNAKIVTGKDDPLVSIVALADVLSCAHGLRYEKPIDEADFRLLVKRTGLDVSQVGEILGKMDSRIEATAQMLEMEDEFLGKPASSRSRRVVLLSTDSFKTGWAQQLLTYYGDEIVPMKQFFAEVTSGGEVDRVLLDPTGVSREQLAKIAPVLQRVRQRTALFGPDPDGLVAGVLGSEPPAVPLAFSTTDLDYVD